MHPLLALLATRPQLLVDHAQAYATLFNEEFDQACTSWQRRAMLQAVALCCLGVAAVLAGVALMLWAVSPELHIHAPWVLWAMPLLPSLAAATCLVMARGSTRKEVFANLTRQISADMAMLRAASWP
jgi:cytochrome bd-type quinol oxidase subunit 2